MKSLIFRLVALILISVMLFAALIGCKSAFNDPDATNKTSESISENSSVSNSDPESNPNDDGESVVELFKNGQYQAKLICADSPSPLDSMVFESIRSLFTKATSIKPTTVTDANIKSLFRNRFMVHAP